MSTSQRVAALGQSLWLDNLSRSLIHDGTLAKLVAEDGVSGVTSNPSIFQSALATGHSTIQLPSSPTAMGRSGIAVYVQRLVGLVEHRFTAPRQVA